MVRMNSRSAGRPETAWRDIGANMLPVDHRTVQAAGLTPLQLSLPAQPGGAGEDETRSRNGIHAMVSRCVMSIPVDGQPAMPTISAFIQLLPDGFDTAPYRATDATVYAVVEGIGLQHGSAVSGWTGWRRMFSSSPSWSTVTHHPAGESVLFSFSDRTCQQKLGIFREQRLSDRS